MSGVYRLTREAQANVDEITEFIAEDNVDAAIRVLDALEDAFALIAANPEIGHNRDDLTDRPVKFWSVYSYLIVYDATSDPVTTIAVLHHTRDVERLLKDRER